jgi:hypothetical protein
MPTYYGTCTHTLDSSVDKTTCTTTAVPNTTTVSHKVIKARSRWRPTGVAASDSGVRTSNQLRCVPACEALASDNLPPTHSLRQSNCIT